VFLELAGDVEWCSLAQLWPNGLHAVVAHQQPRRSGQVRRLF
jgi:hypothetical protein